MLTPFDLFFWAKTAIPSIEFIYVPAAADIEEWTRKLERRFKRAIAIPGTRSFHCYVATRKPGELIASTLPDPLSSLPKETFDVVPSLFSPFICPDLEIDMLLALEFGGDWWLGKLQDIFDEAEEVIVKFYHHPVGSQSSESGFYFPNERDGLTLSVDRIICEVKTGDLKRKSPRSKFFDLSPSTWLNICDTYSEFTEFWSINSNSET